MCGGNIVRKTKLEHIICAQRDSKVRINKTKCILSSARLVAPYKWRSFVEM